MPKKNGFAAAILAGTKNWSNQVVNKSKSKGTSLLDYLQHSMYGGATFPPRTCKALGRATDRPNSDQALLPHDAEIQKLPYSCLLYVYYLL